MTEERKITIYQFRDDLSDDLLHLQRAFICTEEVLERLVNQAQKLTNEKQCFLQTNVFETGQITHFQAQRQLLLLQDKIIEINAIFKYGKLAILKDEGTNYRAF
jgi:hypothetical protein